MVSQGLSLNTKQKLWTLTLALASLQTQLDSSRGETEGDGASETQGEASISTQIKDATPPSPVWGAWKAFLMTPWKSLISTDNNMEPTGDRLGRWEKAKQGNLWDWIKSKPINTHFFHTDEYRRVNS